MISDMPEISRVLDTILTYFRLSLKDGELYRKRVVFLSFPDGYE